MGEDVKRRFSGECLCLARQKRGMSLRQLAKALKKDKSTISRWENGISIPSADDIGDICQVLQIQMSLLYALYKAEDAPVKPKPAKQQKKKKEKRPVEHT